MFPLHTMPGVCWYPVLAVHNILLSLIGLGLHKYLHYTILDVYLYAKR